MEVSPSDLKFQADTEIDVSELTYGHGPSINTRLPSAQYSLSDYFCFHPVSPLPPSSLSLPQRLDERYESVEGPRSERVCVNVSSGVNKSIECSHSPGTCSQKPSYDLVETICCTSCSLCH